MSSNNGNNPNPQPHYSEEDLQNLEYLDMPTPKRGRLHEIILKDPISQLNVPKPIVLDAKEPVSKAVKMMKKLRYGSTLVFLDNKLAGIFTEKDLLVKTTGQDMDLSKVALSQVMTPNPQALEEDDTIAHALHLMSVGGYRHIPIVRDGYPIGFVSIRGILKYIADNALSVS